MTFSFAQIAVCALIGGVASVLAMAATSRGDVRRALPLGGVVAASIALWRAAGNAPALNDDAIPWVSPNDLLAPVVTYVFVSLYGGLAQADRAPEWARVRALLVAASLVANVLAI